MKFKLITLNILHGGIFFESITSFVKEEKPDILVCQEVYDSGSTGEKRFRAFDELDKAFEEFLPFNAFQSSYRNITERQEGAEEGNAVFSRFKILKNEKTEIGSPYRTIDERGVMDFSDNPGNLQHVELDVDGKILNVFSLHGIWGFDGFDSDARIEMANTIKTKIEGKENVILAGDTNFNTHATKTIKIIEDGGIKSVFGDMLKSTFNMRHKTNPGFATAVVDMIFVSPEFEVLEKSQPLVDVSDHYPLMVKLQI